MSPSFTLSFPRRLTPTGGMPFQRQQQHHRHQLVVKEDLECKEDDDEDSKEQPITVLRSSLASSATAMTLDNNTSSTSGGMRSWLRGSRSSATLLLLGHLLRRSTGTSQTLQGLENGKARASLQRANSNLLRAYVLKQRFATEDMNRVNRAIALKRRLLVRELIVVSGDSTVKISFIDAVDQYLAEEDVDKKDKMGMTICQLFIQGDMFKITSLSSETVNKLEKSQLQYLERAKLELLTQLSLDKAVMEAVACVELIDC